jgi:hypothetical protein
LYDDFKFACDLEGHSLNGEEDLEEEEFLIEVPPEPLSGISLEGDDRDSLLKDEEYIARGNFLRAIERIERADRAARKPNGLDSFR